MKKTIWVGAKLVFLILSLAAPMAAKAQENASPTPTATTSVTPTPTPAPSFIYFDLGTIAPTAPYELPLGNYNRFQGALGFGFPIDRRDAFLLEFRLDGLPPTEKYSGFGEGLFSILANWRLDLVNPDNPAVFYGILGAGLTWPLNEEGSDGESALSLRMGLGLEIRLSPKTSLLLQTDGLWSGILRDNNPGGIQPIFNNLFSVGFKFERPGPASTSSIIGMPAQASPAGGKGTGSAPEAYFLRAAGGIFLVQIFADDYYDRPVENGIAQEQETLLNIPQGFTASLAGGVQCPDHFSYFASVEWLAKDWGILANAQYTLPDFDLIQPYLYFGLGVDFNNQPSVGPAGQAAAGLECKIVKNLSIFSEVKAYGAFSDWTTGYYWADLYFPVLAGVKYNL